MRYETALRQRARQMAAELGLKDPRIVEAIGETPRHLFLDEALRARAYVDDALPIGFGQTLSKLSTVARMTEALAPRPRDRVLEVGTGSGYQAAVLARLAGEVFTVERIGALALRARRVLHDVGAHHVEVRVGDGALGWEEKAPFDGILVAAAARELPRALLSQLAVGGRLVLPLDERGGGQALRRITRNALGEWEEEVLEACRFVPLVSHAKLSA
jgi:protein-L-isoaspartate(D-aspartate) O-methyltransferase